MSFWSPTPNTQTGLLVDVALQRAAPRSNLLRLEPEGYLTCRILKVGRSMDDVPTNIDAEITAYCARSGLGRLRDAHHGARYAHHIGAFPDHSADGAAGQELAEASKEGSGGVFLIMLFNKVLRGYKELHGNKFEAPTLEAGDDLTDKTALDAIRFHHEESTLTCHF